MIHGERVTTNNTREFSVFEFYWFILIVICLISLSRMSSMFYCWFVKTSPKFKKCWERGKGYAVYMCIYIWYYFPVMEQSKTCQPDLPNLIIIQWVLLTFQQTHCAHQSYQKNIQTLATMSQHPSCQNEVVQMCTKNEAILLHFQTFSTFLPPPRRLPLTPSVTTKGTATARGPTTATPAAWDSMKTKSKVPVTVGEKKMSLECVRSNQGDEGVSKSKEPLSR